MDNVPVAGYMLAAFYQSVGFLSFFVAVLFTIDSIRRHRAAHETIPIVVQDYFRDWFAFWRSIPRDLLVLIGRREVDPDHKHPYGDGYPLQVGIAHTAFAWTFMAFYWSEQNVEWMETINRINVLLPFVWTWLYGRGYLLHLRCLWVEKPHRWRLVLFSLMTFVPMWTLYRIFTHG